MAIGAIAAGSTTEVLADGGTEDLISDPAPSPATLSASNIDVTVAGDALFLTMAGPVTNVQGFQGCTPDPASTGSLNAVLECDKLPTSDASADTTAVAPTAAATTPSLVPGMYDCTDMTTTAVSVGGEHETAGVGGAGTLTLSKNGSVLTADLAGDQYVGGTFTFNQLSDNAAIAADGQTIHVACGTFTISTPVSTANPAAMNVTAGSLTTDGTTLTLIALGTATTNGCTGQTSSTVLTCTPKT